MAYVPVSSFACNLYIIGHYRMFHIIAGKKRAKAADTCSHEEKKKDGQKTRLVSK